MGREATARAERRALRRVAGAEVLSVVDETTEAIRHLQQSHSSITHQFAHDSARVWETLKEQDRRIRDAEGRIVALQAAMLPLARGWRGRLAWLLGR